MKNHILKTIHPEEKNFSAADAVHEAHEWIVNEFAPQNCRLPSGSNGRSTNCTCVGFLAEAGNTRKAMLVAEYLVHYAKMNRDMTRELMYEWAKVASVLLTINPQNRTPYMLPGIAAEPDDPIPMICRNALQGLLNEGRKSWKTAMLGPAFIHAGIGRTGDDSSRGKHNLEIYYSLNIFFTELKQEALPFATRIIREETGTTTRDDDPDDLVLPPHISKHQCYARWCYSRGWKVEKLSSAKTQYKPVSEYAPRPHDDDDDVPLWPQGSVSLRVISWPPFLSYWQRKFPYIKIRKKGADTCTDCQILCNQFRTRQARADRRRALRNPNSQGTDSSQDEDSGDDTESVESSLGHHKHSFDRCDQAPSILLGFYNMSPINL